MQNKINQRLTKNVKAIIIFAVAYISFSGFFYTFNHRYLNFYFPIVETALDFIYPEHYDFHKAKFKSNNKIITCKIEIKKDVIKDGQPYIAVYDFISKTDAYIFSIFPVLIFSLLFAWKDLSVTVRIASLIIAVPVIFIITLLDLSSSIMSAKINMMPQDINWYLNRIFHNGGRQVSALLIAWIAILISCWGFNKK
ncbi:MAG: hypothetical protein HOG03_15670 [Desulfobacula sp.]|uniref:hypothetical protein n=1 Tax=Desulfobacula sp. TaxID=2593537 RepID=UPI001EB595F7|nr:hypothetical protein [Desulfobacula sp.]MBT5546038.1 hypothetical protein [Desulfobacula sp.]MBT6751050.1 hypothetical protein [Desulfobacula sp.]